MKKFIVERISDTEAGQAGFQPAVSGPKDRLARAVFFLYREGEVFYGCRNSATLCDSYADACDMMEEAEKFYSQIYDKPGFSFRIVCVGELDEIQNI